MTLILPAEEVLYDSQDLGAIGASLETIEL